MASATRPAAALLGANRAASAMAPVVTLAAAAVEPRLCAALGADARARSRAHRSRGRDHRRRTRRHRSAPSRLTGYRHMAIHPYPIELVDDAKLRDGTVLHVRPIRPEDAELERAFVNGLSEQTPLLPLLLSAARAHAGDARAIHSGRLRSRDGARGDRRRDGARADAHARRRRPLHGESRRRERGVRDRRRGCLAGTRRRAVAHGAIDRLCEAASASRDSRAPCCARTSTCAVSARVWAS